jgi:hypothetical protein
LPSGAVLSGTTGNALKLFTPAWTLAQAMDSFESGPSTATAKALIIVGIFHATILNTWRAANLIICDTHRAVLAVEDIPALQAIVEQDRERSPRWPPIGPLG